MGSPARFRRRTLRRTRSGPAISAAVREGGERTALQEPGHRRHHPRVSPGVEGPQELLSGRGAAALEHGEDRRERGAFVRRELDGPLGDLPDLDVEVADRTQRAGHPAQLAPQCLGSHRKCVAEHAHGGAKPAAGHAHVVDLLGVLAQAGPGLVCEERAELRPHRGEGNLPHRGGVRDLGGSEIGRARGGEAAREEAGLELRRGGGAKRARPAELVDESLDRAAGIGPRQLDLDSLDPSRTLALGHRDRRVVERELSDSRAVHRKGVGPPARVDLEQRPEGPATGQGSDPLPHRPRSPAEGIGGAVGDRRGDLMAIPPVPDRVGHGLQRGFGAALVLAKAQRPARSMEPPVVGVEVGVTQLSDRAGLHPGRCVGGPRPEPPFHRAQVDGVELPLDLAPIVCASLLLGGHGGATIPVGTGEPLASPRWPVARRRR
jgi:hypothetical protein